MCIFLVFRYNIYNINIYIYIYIYIIYLICIYTAIKTEQFCIGFQICSVILNLFLPTYDHVYNVYNVTYDRYMQLSKGSTIRMYLIFRLIFYSNKDS